MQIKNVSLKLKLKDIAASKNAFCLIFVHMSVLKNEYQSLNSDYKQLF